MEKNDLVLSFLIFRSFSLKRTVQIDQLLLVACRIHRFAGFQELIVDDTALIPPNTEHRLLAKAIRSSSRCGRLSRINVWFFTFRIHKKDPFFIASNDTMQKRLPFVSWKQNFACVFAPLHLPLVQLMWHPSTDLLNLSHLSQAIVVDVKNTTFKALKPPLTRFHSWYLFVKGFNKHSVRFRSCFLQMKTEN